MLDAAFGRSQRQRGNKATRHRARIPTNCPAPKISAADKEIDRLQYIERVPNRGAHPTILLRQSYREGARVRKRTLANLTCLPQEAIEILKRALRGEKLVPADHAFTIERSIPHGHVKAVLGTIRKLGLDTIIASKRSRKRDLVLGGPQLPLGAAWT